ncbi:MAG: hypothetical protein ACK55V_04005 [Alphaproteobacteria bacterium]
MLAGAAGLVALGATSVALPRRAWAADAPADASDITEDFLEKLFANNSEDIKPPGAAARLTQTQYRDILADLERGVAIPKFAATEDSPDLFHTASAISTTPFELKFAHLLALAEANGFELALGTNPRVLFGLRGCRIALSSAETFGTSIQLIESTPDHYTPHCVIGVLDTTMGTITAYNASTVPDAAYVYAQATELEGANMMPTGLYRYDVGTHGMSRKVIETRQPGAWRQARAWPVRRVRKVPENRVLAYTHAAQWDTGNACGPLRPSTGNNIHAAILDATSLKTKFSSAGCQTIPGRYAPRPRKPVGAFSRLREAAGLVSELALQEVDGVLQTRTSDDGKPFRYMLLTGREARIAATVTDASRALKRLRYGSRGDALERLRAALAARGHTCTAEDGSSMGMRTVAALVTVQRELGVPADGIVTPELAGRLGFSLTEATGVPVAEVTPAPETVPEPIAEPVVAPTEGAAAEPLVAPAPEAVAAPPAPVP